MGPMGSGGGVPNDRLMGTAARLQKKMELLDCGQNDGVKILKVVVTGKGHGREFILSQWQVGTGTQSTL
jgi:fumarate hydratase class II